VHTKQQYQLSLQQSADYVAGRQQRVIETRVLGGRSSLGAQIHAYPTDCRTRQTPFAFQLSAADSQIANLARFSSPTSLTFANVVMLLIVEVNIILSKRTASRQTDRNTKLIREDSVTLHRHMSVVPILFCTVSRPFTRSVYWKGNRTTIPLSERIVCMSAIEALNTLTF
jgi:hypothetical protein